MTPFSPQFRARMKRQRRAQRRDASAYARLNASEKVTRKRVAQIEAGDEADRAKLLELREKRAQQKQLLGLIAFEKLVLRGEQFGGQKFPPYTLEDLAELEGEQDGAA